MSKLGKAGWYCVTKGNILLRASLFFCLSDAFLSLNFTPERCFDPANNGRTGPPENNLTAIRIPSGN